MLYVEMEESVRRQMLRATMAAQHNKRAADAGSEDIWNVRTTDVDDKKCRRRYEVFRVSRLLTPHSLNQVKKDWGCVTLHFAIHAATVPLQLHDSLSYNGVPGLNSARESALKSSTHNTRQ